MRRFLILCVLLAGVLLPIDSFAGEGRDNAVKLGAPGLTTVNVSPEKSAFFLYHLAQRLEELGVHVVTAQQIAALLGVERQKQVLGCGDEQTAQCLVELANAVGVDGLVTGSLGRFGETFQLNLLVVKASDGSLLGSYSGRAESEAALLELLGTAARELATEVGGKLHKPVVRTPHQQLSINPLTTLAGVRFRFNMLSFEYERAITDHWTVFGAPEAAWTPLKGGAELFMSGMALSLGARWYKSGPAPRGFYAGARVHLLSGFIHSDVTSIRAGVPRFIPDVVNGGAMFVGIGGETGYSWVLGDGFYLSAGLGVNVDLVQLAGDAGVTRVGVIPLPLLRFNLGWAF